MSRHNKTCRVCIAKSKGMGRCTLLEKDVKQNKQKCQHFKERNPKIKER